MNACAPPGTWTRPHTPYAPRQNPVNQVIFALLSMEEGRVCACRVGLFQRWLGLNVVQLPVPFSTGALANPGLNVGSFRKTTCKSAMQHAVEQNQDCQNQVAARQRTAVGVGVAPGLRPHTTRPRPTTQRRPPARPPAGKAHRSYTLLPHITILVLLILHYQRKIPLHHFLPLDSRNLESAQIPGFWNPMVKNGALGFFS
jgi:hypothetical protein